MVVCHCEAVNDAAIRAILDECTTSVADIVDRCGAGSACGGCHESIERLLDRHRRERSGRERAVAIASAVG